MTNELENQFFDTFGIEPKFKGYSNTEELSNGGVIPCGSIKYFNTIEEMDKANYWCFNMWELDDEDKDYPQITDRILLELIKILSKEFIFKMFNNFDDDWALMLNTMDKDEQKWFVSCNGFKNALLSLLMNVCNCSDADNIKHQVRTLFEEG